MAQSNRSAASYVAESRNTKKKNPFLGKTMAEMKKMWRGMTPAQRKANEKNFVNAAKTAPKAKPAPKASSSNSNGRSRFFRSSSGTYGQNMPSNPQLKSQPKDKPVKSRGVGVKGRLPQQPKSTSKPSSRGVGVKGRGTGRPAASRPGGRAERARRNPPATATRRPRLSIADRRRARRSSR